MKIANSTISLAAALAAISATGTPANVHAVLFQDLPPGDYVFHLDSYFNATAYIPQPVNSAVGVSNNVAVGAALTDAVELTHAAGAFALSSFGNGLEDLWGVALVKRIDDESIPGSPVTVWTEATSQQQLTVMFYGAQDFFLRQDSSFSQTIAAAGLRADLWLSETNLPGFSAFSPNGTAGRTAPASYITGTDGLPVLTLASQPNFLRDTGDLGGPATEVERAVGSVVTGSGYFSVAPTLGGIGILNADWDSNRFAAPYGNNTADFHFEFASTALGTNYWDAESIDPIRGSVVPAVPEPATGLAALACVGPIVWSRRLRRKI